MASTSYDYIIVGAGSAGCVLANRLSADRDTSVLLLEAGGKDTDPWIRLPMGWVRMLIKRDHDWGYSTEHEKGLAGRKIDCARGKVLGGCSSTNAMAFVRGHPDDYDRWDRNGAQGWSFHELLDFFKRAETWQRGGTDYRGGEGPLTVRQSVFDDPLVEAFIAAAGQIGIKRLDDYNSGSNVGIGRIQQTIRRGLRCSAARAYLKPIQSRKNLNICLNTLVQRVVIEGHKATGVALTVGGRPQNIRAEREIILCGGVINSPQLLMLSGIGPADDLRSHNLPVRVDNSNVGANLQDHISVCVEHRRLDNGSFRRQMRYDRLAMSLARAFVLGTGPATDFPNGLSGFIKLDETAEVPDLQLMLKAAPDGAGPWFPGITRSWDDSFGCRVVLLHPESRGTVRLASRDPADHPVIKQNFFSSPRDMDKMRHGIRVLREIIAKPALAPHRREEISPGVEVTSDDGLKAFIEHTAITVNHPCGTCRMGNDEHAVVAPDLRVKGVESLRVVDASVMPDLVSGNINAAVIAIAEKGADLIRTHV